MNYVFTQRQLAALAQHIAQRAAAAAAAAVGASAAATEREPPLQQQHQQYKKQKREEGTVEKAFGQTVQPTVDANFSPPASGMSQ
jgi:hypothetical protein